MRLSGTKTGSANQYCGLGNQLYDLAGSRPSLDLRFAESKSLNDYITGLNLITFSRSSTATYYDSDGLIKKATTNYFEHSEGFNGAGSWGKGPSKGTLTDNAALAPDETTTATLYVEDSSINGRYISNQSNFVENQSYTVSCWAKQYTTNRYFGMLFPNAGFSINISAVFDLTGDGIATVTNGLGTASIEAYPNGWYRCSLTATATTTAPGGIQFRLTNSINNATANYQGDGASGIYIWGAQLEESSTLGEYVKTTGTINSAPRFDHDPVTGECLGLLIEDTRDNLVRYSEVNFGIGWNNSGSLQPENLSLNKLGMFNGVRVKTNGANWHSVKTHATDNNAISLEVSKTYTVSYWFMDGDINPSGKLRLSIKVQGISGGCVITSNDLTDLNSYSFINASVNHGTISNVNLEDAGDSVYRVTFNFVPSVTSPNYALQIGPFADTVGESIIALGVQVEEGPNPSSYIPTNGSEKSRSTDIVNITGTNFSSWYGNDEGTIFSDNVYNSDSGVFQFVYALSDGAAQDEIYQFKKNGNRTLNFVIRDSLNGTTVNQSYGSSLSFGQQAKSALTFDVNSAFSDLNDLTIKSEDTNVTIPVLNQVRFGERVNSQGSPFLTIKRFTYWPSRLPNGTLGTITKQF